MGKKRSFGGMGESKSKFFCFPGREIKGLDVLLSGIKFDQALNDLGTLIKNMQQISEGFEKSGSMLKNFLGYVENFSEKLAEMASVPEQDLKKFGMTRKTLLFFTSSEFERLFGEPTLDIQLIALLRSFLKACFPINEYLIRELKRVDRKFQPVSEFTSIRKSNVGQFGARELKTRCDFLEQASYSLRALIFQIMDSHEMMRRFTDPRFLIAPFPMGNPKTFVYISFLYHMSLLGGEDGDTEESKPLGEQGKHLLLQLNFMAAFLFEGFEYLKKKESFVSQGKQGFVQPPRGPGCNKF